MKKQLPYTCPSCQSALRIVKLHCDECQTEISGSFDFPPLCTLEPKDQQFLYDFVLASGSLKDMAQQMKLSYPTVRNMLDDIIEKLKKA